MFWLLIFAAALGAPRDEFRQELAAGPLGAFRECAALAALAVNELNKKHPDQDFLAACSPAPERRAADRLYSLQELVDLAVR